MNTNRVLDIKTQNLISAGMLRVASLRNQSSSIMNRIDDNIKHNRFDQIKALTEKQRIVNLSTAKELGLIRRRIDY